jgi:hypothetical protein
MAVRVRDPSGRHDHEFDVVSGRQHASEIPRTYSGPAPSTYSTSVTEMQWLPPTAANVAQSLVTIPAGFQQVSSPADQ